MLGGYLVLFPRARVVTVVFIIFFFTVLELPAMIFLGIWFVQQALFGYFGLTNRSGGGGGVAYFAHIGGFVFGLLAIKLFASRARVDRPAPGGPARAPLMPTRSSCARAVGCAGGAPAVAAARALLAVRGGAGRVGRSGACTAAHRAVRADGRVAARRRPAERRCSQPGARWPAAAPRPRRSRCGSTDPATPCASASSTRRAPALLFDVDTGRVLWRRDPTRVLPIASLTKMMTALVVDDRVPRQRG